MNAHATERDAIVVTSLTRITTTVPSRTSMSAPSTLAHSGSQGWPVTPLRRVGPRQPEATPIIKVDQPLRGLIEQAVMAKVG
jgi:hypothetical protein